MSFTAPDWLSFWNAITYDKYFWISWFTEFHSKAVIFFQKSQENYLVPTAGVSTRTCVLCTPLMPWNVSGEENPLTALTPLHGWLESHPIQMMILCAL